MLVQRGDVARVVPLAVEFEPILAAAGRSHWHVTIVIHDLIAVTGDLTVRDRVFRVLNAAVKTGHPLQNHRIVSNRHSAQRFWFFGLALRLQTYGSSNGSDCVIHLEAKYTCYTYKYRNRECLLQKKPKPQS